MTKTILLLALLSASTVSCQERFDDDFVYPQTQCNTYTHDYLTFLGENYDDLDTSTRCKLPVMLVNVVGHTQIQRCEMHSPSEYDRKGTKKDIGPDFIQVTKPPYGYIILFGFSLYLIVLVVKNMIDDYSYSV